MNNKYAKEEYCLNNGLKIILQRTPTPRVFGRLRINHGGLHELPGEEGRAHFLEHALLNGGTQKYTPGEQELRRGRFGCSNATTNRIETTFEAGFLPEKLERYLDFVKETVFFPRLDERVINQERQRILREIADKKGESHFEDYQLLIKEVTRSFEHSYFVLGREEVVETSTGKNLRDFYERGYSINNADLILVGNLPEDTLKLIEDYFKDLPQGPGKKISLPKVSPLEEKVLIHSAAPDLLVRGDPKKSNSHLNLWTIVPDESHPDNAPLRVLSDILGGTGGISRLLKRVSNEEGLAYRISGGYDGKFQCGYFCIDGSVLAQQSDRAIDCIFEEMALLKEGKVGEEECEQSKNRINYEFAENLERSQDRVESLEYEFDTGITTEDLIAQVNAVTPASIQLAAQKYLPSNRSSPHVLLLRDPLKSHPSR